MMRSHWPIRAVSFLVAAAGFLLPLWPLCAVGILIAAVSGRYAFAILTGLLIDLAWGAPQGAFHWMYVPFTLLAVVVSLARYVSSGYFLDRAAPDTL